MIAESGAWTLTIQVVDLNEADFPWSFYVTKNTYWNMNKKRCTDTKYCTLWKFNMAPGLLFCHFEVCFVALLAQGRNRPLSSGETSLRCACACLGRDPGVTWHVTECDRLIVHQFFLWFYKKKIIKDTYTLSSPLQELEGLKFGWICGWTLQDSNISYKYWFAGPHLCY